MKTKTISLEVPAGKKAEWKNGVLTLVDEKPRDVTERIKTFADACQELGENHPLVKELQMCEQMLSPDLEAYLRLRIITAALNEGWKPQFTKDEYRWFPWYYLITKEDYDKLSEEEKKYAVARAGYSSSAYGGVAYAGASYGSSYANATLGSRLAFKSEELAVYAGKQFIETYADFCFLTETK